MHTANGLQLGGDGGASRLRRLHRRVTSGVRGRMVWLLAACGLLVIPASTLAAQHGSSDEASGAAPGTDNFSKLVQAMTNHATNHVSLDAQQTSTGSTSTQQHVSVNSTMSDSRSTGATVDINGETHHVSKGGQLHKTISQPNGRTNVDVSVDGSGQAAQSSGTSSTSSISVQINSSSSTEEHN